VSGNAVHRTLAALSLLLSACNARCPSGGSPSPVVLVVQQRLIDARNGDVLGPLPPAPGLELHGDKDAVPEPGEPDSYAVGPFVVSTRPPRTRLRSGARIASEIDAVVFDEPSGARRWATPLDGAPRASAGREVVAIEDAVAVRLQSELLVLDAVTGARRWTARGSHTAMTALGPLVATIERTTDAVAARSVVDGVEAFRMALRAAEPSLQERDGHLMILDRWGLAGARLVDIGGDVVLDLREGVADVQRLGGDWLVVGVQRLFRVSPAGETRWALAPVLDAEQEATEAAVMPVGDDDIVVLQWNGGGDSGVGVARVSATGVDRWRHVAQPLRVMHSEYYHRCYALLDGASLIVVSQASGGSFLERIDVHTGALLDRWRYDRRPGE
jgi:hypothetical protein